ncbi:MAG: hypothetical protein M1823_004913 [Watsoniomyces obsoletus]|nr:MAG: hypothetical protein M1823_004913 [Watsoniomyces obsoletus]
MFAPPPAQGPYQGPSPYGNSNSAGAAGPPLDATNILDHPSGPDYRFLAGEGTYTLRYNLQLGTPPAPQSEGAARENPLATKVHPPRAGTRLSLVSTGSSKSVQASSSLKDANKKERNSGDADPVEGGSDKGSTQQSVEAAHGVDSGSKSVFGEKNALLAAASNKDANKRRKPKNNIVKSNSSFVSRVIQPDQLAKRLPEHGQERLLAFGNVHRVFQWLDLASANPADFMTKVLFTKGHPLCHDVNTTTKNFNHIDVVMGFSTGDIIWYEPISQKYARLNKNGAINPSAVYEIRWIPGSENLFLAAHGDGSLIVYDKEKEDAPFVPEDNLSPRPAAAPVQEAGVVLQVDKSVNSSSQKFNPVACWKLSKQRINAFAFAPDGQHLAVVSEDGTLRLLDYLREELLDVYSSYYGGFTCVCWSPDSKYILTGGQDDLVSIWSLTERRLVARCEGHQSWVSYVAFDPWRCEDGSYRFGSVGEDCRLLLWDFSVNMLHRPKAASIRQRGSISSTFGGARSDGLQPDSQASSRLRSNSNLTSSTAIEASVVNHPVQSRLQTARLPPVMSAVIDPHPLCWFAFQEDCIITSCTSGHIRTWDRPREDPDSHHD